MQVTSHSSGSSVSHRTRSCFGNYRTHLPANLVWWGVLIVLLCSSVKIWRMQAMASSSLPWHVLHCLYIWMGNHLTVCPCYSPFPLEAYACSIMINFLWNKCHTFLLSICSCFFVFFIKPNPYLVLFSELCYRSIFFNRTLYHVIGWSRRTLLLWISLHRLVGDDALLWTGSRGLI